MFEKDGFWYVRRNFPTSRKYKDGRLIYTQVVRACYPKTEEQAAALARSIYDEFYGNQPAPLEERTVLDHLRLYADSKGRSVSRRVHESHDSYISLYVEPSGFGSMPLTAVKPHHVQEYYDSLHLTASVLHKLHKLLSAAFAQAVRWDTLVKNPCVGVILPKNERKDLAVLDTSAAKRFIAACRETNDLIVLEFALETGARPGEYLALTWSDINLDRREAHIRRALARGFKGGGFEMKDPKTKGSRRTIQFSEQMRDRLVDQKAVVEAMKAECRRRIRLPLGTGDVNYKKRKATRAVNREILTNLETLDLVFPNEKGLPHSINNLNRRDFKSVIEKIGLDPKRFHLYALRHSAATLSLISGVHIKAVAEKLGHSGIQTLLSTYSHVLPSMQKEATDKLADVLY